MVLDRNETAFKVSNFWAESFNRQQPVKKEFGTSVK